MHIPIPIPIGAKWVAEARGEVWKLVSCMHCREPYAYILSLEATGEAHDLLFLDGEGSKEEARTKAEENLREKGGNYVLPVPCPNCGSYQDEMVRQLKAEAGINRLQVAGGVITLLAFIPLAFGIPTAWVLTPIVALAGLIVLACGYVVAFRYDPNAGDPEARKAIGRQHAVWGEHLAQCLPARPDNANELA